MLRAILSRRFWAGWAAGVLSSAAVALAIGAWMVFGGGFDASATNQHLRPVAWATHNAMRSWVKKQAQSAPPAPAFTPADVAAGAQAYSRLCVSCHGGPAVGRERWVSAVIPTPPYLVDSSRRWSRAELYVLLRDGIKMSAMPGWGMIEPDQTIWNLVAFLEQMPTMSSAEFARAIGRPGNMPPPPPSAAAAATSAPADR